MSAEKDKKLKEELEKDLTIDSGRRMPDLEVKQNEKPASKVVYAAPKPHGREGLLDTI